MKKGAMREFLIGVGANVSAAWGHLPRSPRRVTIPPETVDAIAHDFSMLGTDFRKSIDKVKHARQLHLPIDL
jgi:hypothetical protein